MGALGMSICCNKFIVSVAWHFETILKPEYVERLKSRQISAQLDVMHHES